MADFPADRQPDWAVPGPVHPVTRIVHIGAAVVSIGLIVGMGVWGYKLIARDVSGVPVIRAAEGPMRIQPDNPGGAQARNQGLSVNDVAAAGIAAPTPDELILAPAPLDLGEEPAPEEVQLAAVEDEEATAAPAADPAASEPLDDAAILALADSIAEGTTPISVEDTPEEAVEEAAPIRTVAGGIGTSLRPRERPVTLARVQTVSAAVDTEATGAQDVDPSTIPAGTRLAQLGAFKTEDIAREEWTKLSTRFEDYLAGKDRVIQRATSGGRTFYRLRAMGFDDLGDARRFCSALVAEKAECIPVVTR